MNCLKCGKEIQAPDVFCPDCQAEMAKHPVPRDAAVLLPTREPNRRPSRKAYAPDDPEQQIQALRRRVRRLRTALRALAVTCIALLALLFFLWQAAERQYPVIGQNYQSSTTPSTTVQEATRP